MSLDSIVSVTITTGASAVARTGFGTPLIAAYHNEFVDLVRTYDAAGGLAALTSDGFDSNSSIYLAAQALLSQNPKVRQFKVGKLSTSTTQTIKLTPVAANSYTYLVTINGLECSFTSDASATVAEICTGLTAAINSTAGSIVTAADNTTHITVTADAANLFYTFADYDIARLQVLDQSTSQADMAADLAAIKNIDNDWYCLLLGSQSEADIEAAAAWIETEKKIFLCDSADYGIIDSVSTTDVLSDLEASAYARTALMYHSTICDYAGAAWAGFLLTLDPGSETWAYKTLRGIVVDELTATQINTITNKTGNYYTSEASVNITRFGKTASGEYIDVTRFVDWLTSRIQEEVYSALVNTRKIPFTDKGISLIVGKIRGVLSQGVRVGGLAEDPAPEVFAPLASEVSSVDKANRLLPDVTFTATLAGAIHTIQISGTVSV